MSRKIFRTGDGALECHQKRTITRLKREVEVTVTKKEARQMLAAWRVAKGAKKGILTKKLRRGAPEFCAEYTEKNQTGACFGCRLYDQVGD